MTKRELTKRYILFLFSLFVSAIGVAITKKGELGVSPVSSVANILSIRFTFFSLGNWLIIWNCILILGQIVLLRKDFQLIQLLQIPLSFLFGYFTDFGLWIFSSYTPKMYWERISCVILGTAVLGCGIALSVIANVIMNSGEAFVKALSDTIRKDFGNVKIGFDISCVSLSIIMSLLFFRGTVMGTREGTIYAALFTGIMVKIFRKLLMPSVNRLLLEKGQ